MEETHQNEEKQWELQRSIMEDTLAVLKPTLSVRIAADWPVKEVIRSMVEKKIGAVLIVDQGKLVGIFSERDIIKKIGTHYEMYADRPINELMTTKPVSLSIRHTIAFALNRMALGDYRHIPVTDEENYPTGIVAVRDIIRYIDHRCLGGPE
ncbi:MAG: CBS domain-containing protein [Candidatus Omnitrophota bacterium]|nr:MAG: CBS domain-containing protein [Candidatus Omnitrophota bacterium]